MQYATGPHMCTEAMNHPFTVDHITGMVRNVFEGRVAFHDGAAQIDALGDPGHEHAGCLFDREIQLGSYPNCRVHKRPTDSVAGLLLTIFPGWQEGLMPDFPLPRAVAPIQASRRFYWR